MNKDFLEKVTISNLGAGLGDFAMWLVYYVWFHSLPNPIFGGLDYVVFWLLESLFAWFVLYCVNNSYKEIKKLRINNITEKGEKTMKNKVWDGVSKRLFALGGLFLFVVYCIVSFTTVCEVSEGVANLLRFNMGVFGVLGVLSIGLSIKRVYG